MAGWIPLAQAPLFTATTWNSGDRNAAIILSNVNLTTTNNTGGAFACIRGVASHSSGKYYYEVTAITQTFASFSNFGVGNATAGLSTFMGGDANSVQMAGNGSATCNGVSIGSGDGLGSNGQTEGIAWDIGAQKIWWWNSAAARWNGDILANQNPATGTGGFSTAALAAGPYFPMISIWQLNDSFTANFGGTAYSITIPAGFSSW